MSEALIPLAIQILTQMIPVVTTVLDQVKNGTLPTAEQIAELDAALEKANEAIQAS